MDGGDIADDPGAVQLDVMDDDPVILSLLLLRSTGPGRTMLCWGMEGIKKDWANLHGPMVQRDIKRQLTRLKPRPELVYSLLPGRNPA